MVKFRVYTSTPRCVIISFIYLCWILTSIPLVVLVAKAFPSRDCVLYDVQNYDNIEFRSAINSGKEFCSYSVLYFQRKSKFYEKKICSFCNNEKKDSKRDECISEDFYKESEITREQRNFRCIKGYNADFLVLGSEKRNLLLTRIGVVFALIFYLILPFIAFAIFAFSFSIFYKNSDILHMALWDYTNMMLFKSVFKGKQQEYNLLWDPASRNISERRKKTPFLSTKDPVYKTLRDTHTDEFAEQITWIDNRSRFVTKNERKYVYVSGVLLLSSISLLFILMVEKYIFAILSPIILDVLAPFLDIFIFWNIFLFILWLIYKFTTYRIITNRRVIMCFRIPIYGAVMQYVRMEDIEEVGDREQCIYVKVRNGRKVKIFRTHYNSTTCVNVIREQIDKLMGNDNNEEEGLPDGQPDEDVLQPPVRAEPHE